MLRTYRALRGDNVGMLRGLALRPSWPYVGEVARSLLGVLLAVVAALRWGLPSGAAGAAVAAGGTAAFVGVTAMQDRPHSRLPVVLGVTAGMAAAVLIGSLTSPHIALFVIAVAVWCLGAGMLWAVSASAGLVAAAATGLLVTCSATPTSLSSALTAALFAVVGGVTQVVLVAAWPRRRWHAQKDALAAAYRSLAVGADALADDPGAALDTTSLIALRESFTLTERQARRRPPAHRGLYGLPERIAMTLSALRHNADMPEVREVLSGAAVALASIGDTGRFARGGTQAALRRVQRAVDDIPSGTSAPARRLLSQLREAAALRFAGTAEPTGRVQELRRTGIVGSLRGARDGMAAQLSWDSPILRHAVRLAAAAAVGSACARISGLGHGYWIALTVVMVLRPETAHTYTRCITRVLGNAVGITVATAITVLAHPSDLGGAVLAVLFLAVAYGVSGIGYVPFSAALAAGIAFLLDIGAPTASEIFGEQLLATLIGGGLAVASHVLLPDRSLVRLRQRAGELLKAEIDYAATTVRFFVHPVTDPDAVLSAAWQRATRARSAFEAASGSVRADTAHLRRWLIAYRSALNAVTGACATLETQVPAASTAHLDRRFVTAVDDYVDALRGETPSGGQPWTIDVTHLSEAEQQLKDAAGFLGKQDTAQRVLIAEVETITRHLLAISGANDL
jgi:uncharacterized membrane protein YccC